MEYLVLIEFKDGKTKVELFWTEDEAQRRKCKVVNHHSVKGAFLYRNAE